MEIYTFFIQVLGSEAISKGTIITINAQGAVESLRNKKDGITYFGCKKYRKKRTKSEPVRLCVRITDSLELLQRKEK